MYIYVARYIDTPVTDKLYISNIQHCED